MPLSSCAIESFVFVLPFPFPGTLMSCLLNRYNHKIIASAENSGIGSFNERYFLSLFFPFPEYWQRYTIDYSLSCRNIERLFSWNLPRRYQRTAPRTLGKLTPVYSFPFDGNIGSTFCWIIQVSLVHRHRL